MPEIFHSELVVDTSVVHALGLALLHSLWQGVLIGILFMVVSSTMRKASPDLRYWTGVSALALLAASVPLTTVYLLTDALPDAASPGSVAVEPGVVVGSLRVQSGSIFGAGMLIEWTVALWIAGVTLVSARTLLAWRRLSTLRRAADLEAAAPLRQLVDRLHSIFRLRGHVAIALSASIGSPMVIGWIKPMILLPAAVAARLPREQLEMIVAHELAHLQRHDHWVNLFQVATETLMFYHPVVALISRRIRVERENACDDLAVAATRRRLDYVEMLAALEKTRGTGPALALGVKDGQILARIRRLVDRSEPRTSRGGAVPALVALVAVGALVAMPLVDRTTLERQSPEPPPFTRPAIAASPATPLATSTRIAPVAEIRDAPAPEETDRTMQPKRPELSGSIELPAIEGVDAGVARPDAVVAQPAAAATGTPEADYARSINADPSQMVDAGPAEEDVQPVAANIDKPATYPTEAADSRQPSRTEARPEPSGIETPRLDTSVLLARHIDKPAILPQDAPAAANPAESLNDEAQRTAEMQLGGGEPLREVYPDYPRTALQRGIAGSVEVELWIDTNGRVGEVAVLKETPVDTGFAAAARRAANLWKFEPYTLDGEPVARRKTVVFDFRPGDECRAVTGTRLHSC